MSYRKESAKKKSYVTRFVLAREAILSHFHTSRPTFLQYPALKLTNQVQRYDICVSAGW